MIIETAGSVLFIIFVFFDGASVVVCDLNHNSAEAMFISMIFYRIDKAHVTIIGFLIVCVKGIKSA